MNSGHRIYGQNEEPSGSPHKGEPVYLVIGRLRRPHGVAGEILFEMISDNPKHFEIGNHVFVGSKKQPLVITSLRQANKLWLIAFEGYESREQAALITNKEIYIREDGLNVLPDGLFYHHEVVGMRVLDENNTLLGEVSEILVTGANDVYVVAAPDGTEFLIPAIKSVILGIDRDTRSMVIRPQDWA